MEPVLVLDQAFGRFLETYGDARPTTPSDMRAIEAFTRSGKLTVFLSPEAGTHPQTMEGLNLQRASGIFLVGEKLPSSMWELLTSATYQEDIPLCKSGKRITIKKGEKMVGMGPNLAKVFMSIYGGNFLRMSIGMNDLRWSKEGFHSRPSLYERGGQETPASLNACRHDDKRERYSMRSLFENVAIQGYAMLDTPYNSNAIKIDLPRWNCHCGD